MDLENPPHITLSSLLKVPTNKRDSTMAVQPSTSPQEPSALQKVLDESGAKTPNEALPLEIMHNLRYQHNWTNLEILKRQTTPRKEDVPSLNLAAEQRSRSPSGITRKPTSTSSSPTLLSGHPPKSIYIHPTYQAHLLLQEVAVESVQSEIEYVFPLTLGQSFTLRLLQSAFDSIPGRESIVGENGFKHQDAKRLLLAMRGRQGVGGDGTVNYYVVQEGEVKPRQN
jgi:tRNA-splicing endonuclease subunit Sen15